jgi:ABC-type protease/lipase transport system fused ATPase/permease subunit
MLDARAGWRELVALLRSPAPLAHPRLPEVKGALALEGVTVAAVGRAEPLLKAVSLRLRPGEAVGVVGPSGAGKSTLLRAMAGAVAPQAGQVLLDGLSLLHLDPDQRGEAIGYLPQGAALFEGTVAENIARFQDGFAMEAVYAAAALAGAHATIMGLPQGYATQLGFGGQELSGGQRQRVALARALFGEPPLVLLDEPDAHLDDVGESALLTALAELKRRGVTLVVAGHRARLLNGLDRLVVLSAGAVTLDGPRERVVAQLRGGMAPPPVRVVAQG